MAASWERHGFPPQLQQLVLKGDAQLRLFGSMPQVLPSTHSAQQRRRLDLSLNAQSGALQHFHPLLSFRCIFAVKDTETPCFMAYCNSMQLRCRAAATAGPVVMHIAHLAALERPLARLAVRLLCHSVPSRSCHDMQPEAGFQVYYAFLSVHLTHSCGRVYRHI
jgi:hypothetical protein